MTTAASSSTPSPLSLGLHFQLLKRAGSLISSLDELRNDLTGVAELSFPQIIVVGEESSGKSSVLERIAMLQFFPRSDTMCTRMPIKLQLKHKSESDMEQFCNEHKESYYSGVAFVRARLDDAEQGPGAWSAFLPVNKVEGLLKETMEQAVTNRNSQAVGVIEDVVVVEVISSRVPNLTLIDLPGVCVNPRRGEPENIMERTHSLVEKYLRQEHTLVLLVIPALSRMHGYLPLKLVRQHDRLAHTVGVLTKTDLAARDRFQDRFHELKRQLNGQSEDYIALHNGYVAVRNRDTARPHDSLEDVSVEEKAWFDKHLPGFVNQKLASSPVLIEKLVEMMCTYVESTWAEKAKAKINERLAKINADLAALGPLRQARDLPLIFADVSSVFSGPGAVDLNTIFSALMTKAALKLPCSTTVGHPKPYPFGAIVVKSELQIRATSVLRDASLVSDAVAQLLGEVKKRPALKLARFGLFFTALEAVLAARFQSRAKIVERFERQLNLVFALFDSNPDLQSGSTQRWEIALHARFVALLKTVIFEEVLFPLETALRELGRMSDDWTKAMVLKVKETVKSPHPDVNQLKELLVEESVVVATERAELTDMSQKLNRALSSIANLRSTRAAC